MLRSTTLRRFLGAYVAPGRWIWNHLSISVRSLPLGRAYGSHVHAAVRLYAERRQSFATFFLRNRAELELMRRLVVDRAKDSPLDMAVLACSKGAEVYSMVWTLRRARPDLNLRVHAVDISQEMLDFAQNAEYSLDTPGTTTAPNHERRNGDRGAVTWNTRRDQKQSMFERMTPEEMDSMFEVVGSEARIRGWLRREIAWLRGDAGDPELVRALGPQDIVVANRFLCHVEPPAAEACLRNIARLVKPGGYLFVSGIDLNVRSRVARDLGWKPVTDLVKEIHEGDYSLLQGWPLEYWGLEPFCEDRPDYAIRYAAVFQIGERAPLAAQSAV
jgi:chemotaxis methyl-accepting protein methylase